VAYTSNLFAVNEKGKPLTNELDYTGFEQLMTTATYAVLTQAYDLSEDDVDF